MFLVILMTHFIIVGNAMQVGGTAAALVYIFGEFILRIYAPGYEDELYCT